MLRDAIAQHRAGNLRKAEELYRRVLTADPDNARGLNGLGLIALRFNHLDVARQYFSRSCEIAPDLSETHRYLGAVFSALQDHEQAIRCYEMALKLNPDDPHAAAFIDLARRDLRIASDPDYALLKTAPWNDDDSAWEDTAGNPIIFVLFSGLGVGANPPTFIFSKFLSNYTNVDKLFLRDLGKQWYLNGLGGISSNVEQTADFLREKIDGYARAVFIGCSAGGMAAILYGELLQPDKVLAFAPQTVLSDAKEKEYNDTRWLDYLRVLRQNVADPEYLDLKCMEPYSARIDIHYSSGCEVDRLHAGRIAGKNLKLFSHDGTDGHLIALHLRDNGSLRTIIENEIVADDPL